MPYQSKKPYNNEVLATFDTLTDAQLEEKLAKAHEAFQSWKNTTFEERAAILHRAAELVMERREELASYNTLETGKLFMESAWEMNVVADMFNHYADHGAEYLKPEIIKNPDQNAGDAVGIYQPTGIIYQIEPWNAPYFQIVRPMSATLMAGNVMVLKHASNVPQCALAMEKLMRDAGAPEGVFTNLFVSYEQSDRVIADPRVTGVTITGSTEVGRGVAATAGQNLKKIVLELGGSYTMVVLDDADMEKVMQGAMVGRLTLSGQACVGDKRLFIHSSLYDTFMEQIKEAVCNLVSGDPMDQATTLAPVVNKKAADKVRAQIALAVEHGATATTYGQPVPEDTAFVQPTILTNVTPDNPIFNEEIFGPVLMIFSFDTEEEVVALANGTQYGLGSSVYTESPERAYRLAAQMESGAVSVNQPTLPSPAIPFGGIKNSGYGRELGADGIREFTNQKYINSNSIDMKVFHL